MRKAERRLLNRCPGCTKRLYAGAIFSVILKVEDAGSPKVYRLNSDSVEDCTAVYLGCVIADDMLCPVCGADVQETAEVEYSDKCELCGNRPSGKTWYWDSSGRRYVGLCDGCSGSAAGEAWIAPS